MPVITLSALKDKTIQTPGRYLSIVNASGQFKITAPTVGMVVGKLGRQYVLDNITDVTFVNETGADIEIEYEVANIQIFGSGSGTVSIENKPIIQRIEESIQVDAQATVENGTMTTQSHNMLAEVVDINVPAGQKVQILPASADAKRTVFLQVISDTQTKVRVGGGTVAAGRGLLLNGSLDSVESAEFESLAAVYVYNEAANPAKVAVMVGSR